MVGLTLTSTIDLPADPVYWVDAFGLDFSFNDGTIGETLVTYSLIESGNTPHGEAYRALTAPEITNIESSIAAVTQYANIRFVEGAAADADILIGASSDSESETVYGRTWQRTTQPVQVVAYDQVYSDPNGLANNSYIYIHEIMHGVGLDHSAPPFNSEGLIGDAENDGTTLFGQWLSGWDGELQIFDIAAMQYLYSPDPTMRAGDDTYSPNPAAYDPSGDDSDSPLLWDGSGFDTIDLSARTDDISATLAPGVISRLGASDGGILGAGTFAINYNTEIEQLFTGSGDDNLNASDFGSKIMAGAGDDTVTGGAGDDTISGGIGEDTLDGGEGVDTADFAYSSAQVNFDLDAGTADFVGNLVETMANFENVIAGGGDNIITGNNADNVLTGGDGDDIINGGFGEDTLDGGDGVDTADFAYSSAQVNFDLDAGTADFVGIFVETMSNFENVIAGGGDNSITGNNADNVLTGGGGDDTFVFADGFGDDVITDFDGNDLERVDLSGVTGITDFADLVANHLADVGGNAQIQDGANTITLEDVSVSDIGSGEIYSGDDFIF